MEEINHEYYVSLEVAKLLEKTGFDWECKKIYFKTEWKGNDDVWEIEDNKKKTNLVLELDYYMLAPTLDVAQRWLREVKHLDVIINRNFPIHEHKYSWEYEYVIITTDGRVEAVDCYFEEYEQAQEAGIKKALEIILEKGDM